MSTKPVGRKPGSPKALKPEVRRLIYTRALIERDLPRDTLADLLIEQIEANGDTAPTFETTIKYISQARNEGKSDLDKPWSTAALISQPLNWEIVPWLVGAQFNLSQFLAKPLTLRQALWFCRLYGFKNNLEPGPELVTNPQLKVFFIGNALTTLSLIYAFRERIDSIGGKQELNFSDLDAAVLKAGPKSILEYSGGILNTEIQHLLDRKAKPIANGSIIKWDSRLTSPLVSVRYLESLYLSHAHGEPEMETEPLRQYHFTLAMLTVSDDSPGPEFRERFQRFTYLQRIHFLIGLRRQLGKIDDIEHGNLEIVDLLDQMEKGKPESEVVLRPLN
jgi:hypothetical protein